MNHLVRRFHLQAWVIRNAPKLQSLGATLARPALNVGKGAVSMLATLGTIFALLVLFLLEGPKMGRWLLDLMPPERAAYCGRVVGEISQSVTGYAFGNLLTSLIAGLVVFVTLTVLRVPFPLLWAVWVAPVDFLPMIGGALAGIPTVLFALGHSLTAGIVTAAAFIAYQQIENHVLNPVVMSRTVKINPLLVLLSILVGTSIGDWVGGFFGSFVAALLSIPVAGALQVIARELWQITGQPGPSDYERAAARSLESVASRPPGRTGSPRWHPASMTSSSRRAAAEQAVSGLTGVRNVRDEIEISYDLDPVDIDLHVQEALDRSALVPDDSDVKVATMGGTITLTGDVRTWAEHDAVVGAAWMARGVIDVDDQLQITG